MSELSDRVVVVTGGSAGIGRATVERLVAGGARVVTCARDGDRLAEAVGALPGVTRVTADVADAGDRDRLLRRRWPSTAGSTASSSTRGWAGPGWWRTCRPTSSRASSR
jgi:NADP-dependent 3-hydroxy acid dehydrogenase YdfG